MHTVVCRFRIHHHYCAHSHTAYKTITPMQIAQGCCRLQNTLTEILHRDIADSKVQLVGFFFPERLKLSLNTSF